MSRKTKYPEAKDYLQQVYKAQQRFIQANYALEELRHNQNITVGYERAWETDKENKNIKRCITRMKQNSHGGIHHDISDIMIILEKEQQEVDKYQADWLSKRAEIKKFIFDLDIDEKVRQVLIYRYVSLKDWAEIAVELRIDYSWILKLNRIGLKYVAKKLVHIKP